MSAAPKIAEISLRMRMVALTLSVAIATDKQAAGRGTMTDDSYRARYPHWTTVTLRYSDQDSMGHVNNVSFAAYVEAGRVAFEHAHMFPVLGPRQDFYLASLHINYRRQLHYPGTVEIGTGVVKLGRTSLTLAHGIFHDGALVADAESVIVLGDVDTGTPTALPDAARAVLGVDALAVRARRV
jgi:acyl-CoA thioester hydrolase